MKKKDIVIVGAGPAGLSFARLLAHSGLSIAIVDKQKQEGIASPIFDGRDIALTHLSRTILTEINVWQRFDKDVIHLLKEATVQDGGAPYALHFERTDDDEAPLGYLIANHHIRHALYQEVIEHDNISFFCEHEVRHIQSDSNTAFVSLKQANGEEEILQADLVVAADSRFSNTRQMMGIGAKMKDYGRVMIVCNMKHQGSHNNTAQECFYYGRTCAILPLGNGVSSIVITTPASRSTELTQMDDAAFTQEVERMFEHRLGSMELFTKRYSYPLIGVFSDRFVGQRFALVGDAAVGMHPVTAHGYNLGLRSADTLAKQIIKAAKKGKDIASNEVLQSYQLRHRLLARPLYDATNIIVRLFTDDSQPARFVRKVALRVGNNIKPFKKLVTHRLTQIR